MSNTTDTQNTTPHTSDVDEASFTAAVIERSRQLPVVVDFWAPWCGPCRTLGPTLERLAAESGGAWQLVKVNVDSNQRLAEHYQVQGIPAVKAFHDGRVVDEFTGALPERQVRAWLAKFVAPAASPVDALVADADALAASNPGAAETIYRAAIERDAASDAARIGLGALLLRRGDPQGRVLLAAIEAGAPLFGRAQAWLTVGALVEEALAADSEPGETSLARIVRAGRAIAAADDQGAIDALLAIVAVDRGFREDGARRTLLALLSALGEAHPLAAPARRALANLLF